MEASWGGISAWEATSQEAGHAAGSPGPQEGEEQGEAERTCTGPGGGPAGVQIPVLTSTLQGPLSFLSLCFLK